MSLNGNNGQNNGQNGNQNGHRKIAKIESRSNGQQSKPEMELISTPLLPPGYRVPATRNVHPSICMRELLRTEPFLFGPGVSDSMTARLVLSYAFKAISFSVS